MVSVDRTRLFATFFSLLLLISMISIGFGPSVGASPAPEDSSQRDNTNRLPGEAYTQTDSIDAEIVDVDYDSGIHREGDPVRVTVTVENTGSESNRFYLGFSVRNPSGEWLDGDDEASIYLRPGERTTTDVIWYVSEDDESGMYDARVSVWEEGDPNNLQNRVADNQKSDSFEVEQPTTKAEITGFNVESGTYHPGDSVTGSVTVENTGDTTHPFWVDFSAVGSDGGWSVGEGETVELSPDESRTIELTWDITDDSEPGTYDGGTAVYKSESKDTKYDGKTRFDAFEVEQPTTKAEITGFNVESGTYQPGDSVTGSVTVENTGDTTHSFWVDFSAVGPDGGWSVGEGETVELSPGESQTVELTWDLTDDSEPGTYDGGTGVYKSESKDTKYDGKTEFDTFEVETETEEYQLRATTDGEGGFEVNPPGISTTSVERDYEEGTEVVLTATSGPDSQFVGWSGDIGSADEGDATIELTMDEARDVTASFKKESQEYQLRATTDGEGGFEVDPPGISTTSVERDYEKGTEVELTATPGPDSEFVGWSGDIGFADEDDTTIEVTMDEARDVTAEFEETKAPEIDAEIVDVDYDSGIHREGDPVRVTVTVENTGSESNRFYLGFSVRNSSGEWVDGDEEASVYLRPGERTTTDLIWYVSEDAETGIYDARVSVWEEGDPNNLQNRVADNQQSDSFEVEKPTTEADITEFDVESGTYKPGESVTSSVTVKNTGDTTSSFWVDFSAQEPDSEWSTGEGTAIELSPGEDRAVELTWTVPNGAEPGLYDGGTAVYQSEDKNQKHDGETGSDAFEVTEASEISGRLTAVETDSGEFHPGDTIEATATVENNGTADHTFFVEPRISGPDGTEYSDLGAVGKPVTVEAGDQTEVTVSFTVPETASGGKYDSWLTLWKEDDPDNLQTRLDENEEYDAFGVEKAADGSIVAVEGIPDRYVLDESYDTTVEVSNPTNVDQEYTVSILDQSGTEVTGSSEKQVTVPAGESKSPSFDVELYGTDTERTVTAVLDAQNGTELDERSVTTEPATAGQIDVLVVNEQGEPIPDVTVVPYDNSDSSATTGSDGRTRLTNVSSGETLVYIDDETYDRDYVEVDVEQGETADVKFTVDETANVAGTISDEVGVAVESGTVVVDGREADIQNGKFAFDRPFEPGSKEVLVRINGTIVHETEERLETGDNGLAYDVSVPADGDLSTAELAYIATESFASTAYKGFIFGESGSSIGAIGSGSDAYKTGSGLEAAKEVTSEQIDRRIAESHGAAVGLGTGLKEAVEGIIELVKDPLGIIKDLISLVKTVLEDLGVLEEILAMIPQQIQDKQQEANPHEVDSELNESFAYGWYGGYITAYVAEGVLGSKGVSKISKASKLADVRRAPNKKDVFEKNYNEKSGSTPDFFDDLDPSVSTQLKKLDSSTQQRLKKLRDENKLTDADIEQLGTLIDDGLGARQAGQLLEFSFESADQFRTAIIRHGEQVDSDRLNRYISDLDAAQSHENIENIKGLTQEAANTRSAEARGDITGQYGETKQALKYAEEGKRVEVEPGDGALDLKVTDGSSKELVEVKTRVKGKDTDYQYISGKLTAVERKVNNAKANPDVDVSDSDVVLEINTGTKGSDLESTKSAARQAVEDSTGDLAVDKIRLVADDGSVETISVNK